MKANEMKENWEKWRDEELIRARFFLSRFLYTLDDEQLHIGGERFLMSGRKLVLTGKNDKDGTRVVIKFSTEKSGMAEIRHEQETRRALEDVSFSYHSTTFPDQLFWEDSSDHVILITAFIEQPIVFIKLPLQEQFFFALQLLESQEGTHVTTREHEETLKLLGKTMRAEDYLKSADEYCQQIIQHLPEQAKLHQILEYAKIFLCEHRTTTGRYCGFLTHTDFVPHNFRVAGKQITLLDHTALIIGNKYESWARLINFMMLHNPDLERLLVDYVKENRGSDEYLDLMLMRVYKLCFLIDYYTRSYQKTDGDLHELSKERITFWSSALDSILHSQAVPREVIDHYKDVCQRLRSSEERKRQKEISG